MIVEDDPSLAVQLQGDIEDAGHELTDVAISKKTAFELTERDGPDCAIVDILLIDGPTGLDVARFLESKGIPYAFMSAALATVPPGVKAVALINKPYTIGSLERALSLMATA